ncbi:hypothetical protein M0R45_020138 [Rubus argutus]|uniref:Uncharacterized protein n=1 Tax=Rubus argutus TaxID=59490 RepID=A0AAW1X9B0_RUBAR
MGKFLNSNDAGVGDYELVAGLVVIEHGLNWMPRKEGRSELVSSRRRLFGAEEMVAWQIVVAARWERDGGGEHGLVMK